jgi:hypothetical protein
MESKVDRVVGFENLISSEGTGGREIDLGSWGVSVVIFVFRSWEDVVGESDSCVLVRSRVVVSWMGGA